VRTAYKCLRNQDFLASSVVFELNGIGPSSVPFGTGDVSQANYVPPQLSLRGISSKGFDDRTKLLATLDRTRAEFDQIADTRGIDQSRQLDNFKTTAKPGVTADGFRYAYDSNTIYVEVLGNVRLSGAGTSRSRYPSETLKNGYLLGVFFNILIGSVRVNAAAPGTLLVNQNFVVSPDPLHGEFYFSNEMP